MPIGSHRRIPWQVMVVLAAASILAAIYFLRPRSEPNPSTPPAHASTPLPPLSTSPFLNTKPGVEFVGDTACANCHADQCRSYRQHPMGRSLFSAADFPPREQLDSKTN